MFDHGDTTWKTINLWANKEIATMMELLTNPSVKGDELASIRGEIQRLRELLELPREIENGSIELER